MRRFASAGAVLALGILATGCQSSGTGEGGAASDSVVIAVTTELTGPFGTTFSPVADGVRAAVEALNEAGGIGGREVVLAGPFDSQSAPAGGTTAAQQAVNDEPDVIISGGTSTAATAGLPVYAQARIPVISLSGGEDTVNPTIPLHFSLMLRGSQMAEVLIAKAREVAEADATLRLAIVGSKTPSVDSIIAGLEEVAGGANVEIVSIERTLDTLASFPAQASKMVRATPDAIISIDSLDKTIGEVKELRVVGYDGPILATLGAATNAAFASVDDENYYALRLASVPQPGEPLFAAAEAVGAQDAASGSSYFAQGWAAVHTAAAVLAKCGEGCQADDFQSTAETMGDIEVADGALFGPVSFSADRHYGLSAVQFYGWDKAAQAVEPSGDPLTLSE